VASSNATQQEKARSCINHLPVEGVLDNWINPRIGELTLEKVNNAALKQVVAEMMKRGLSAKTINTYTQVVKSVVASVVNEEGEQMLPRKWNHEFVDMPIVKKPVQNTPSFSKEIMSGLAQWKYPRERVLFILSGAAGLRIGEALGLEMGKHISADFRTLTIAQKVRHCVVEDRLKNDNAARQVDLHPAIAELLRLSRWRSEIRLSFPVTGREAHQCFEHHPSSPASGAESARLRQPTYRRPRSRQPLVSTLQEHLLDELLAVPRRNTEVLDGARRLDDVRPLRQVKEDRQFGLEWAENCGNGSELPEFGISVVPNVPKKEDIKTAACGA
jgi:integrase